MTQFRLHGKPLNVRVVLPLRHPRDRLRDLICYEHEGVLLFEGDIIVEPASALLSLAPRPTIGRLGHVLSDPGKTWPNGIIPVDMPDDMVPAVEAAIAVWEEATPLRFPRLGFEDDYVSFVWSSRNASSVGRKSGAQRLELQETADLRTIVHEIGHVVGLYHEHSRPDADQYIHVHEENLEAGAGAQFSQPTTSEVHGSYDYDSITHYDAYAFSKNGQPTITTHNGASIGHSEQLSEGDRRACRALYPNLTWG